VFILASYRAIVNKYGMEHIYSGQIWTKSSCLQQEDRANQQVFDYLRSCGYVQTDHFRIWKKHTKTVIVCLVDDIRSCSQDYHVDLPYLFDASTTVITDNYLTCPSRFTVIQLPSSFFGIYSHTPEEQSWTPDRDFAFQVNRVDPRRFQLMIDLAWRTRLDSGYINFNCVDRYNQQLSPQEAFAQYWPNVDPAGQKYLSTYERILPMMPFKNYEFDFDSIPYRVWINIVVETYASDTVVSVSEKIFRALVTPAPWTVYSGRYTVAYLESLGFDCMSDIIDHNHYDRLKEVEDKLKIFNWKSLEIVAKLKELGVELTRQRCLQASQHNQKLLASLKEQWPTDWTQLLDTLPSRLVD
jgi:hypothetical protein